MEEQSRRLRLIIEVLPLPAAETDAAHGFKGRKFALPVFAEQTIGDVWRLIEERYKRNYLQYTEAACVPLLARTGWPLTETQAF